MQFFSSQLTIYQLLPCYSKTRAIKALENLTWWGRIKCDPLATVTSAFYSRDNILEPGANIQGIEFMFSIGALQ